MPVAVLRIQPPARMVPGLRGVYKWEFGHRHPLCHVRASSPCLVLFCARAGGGRPLGLPGTSGGFCPVLSTVPGLLQGAAVSGSRLQGVWPLCAQHLPGCESLQDLWFGATRWAGRCPWSRAAGWEISSAKSLSRFLSRRRAGPPGSAAGPPGESDSASLSLGLFTFKRGTHAVQGGRPEQSWGCSQAPSTSSCPSIPGASLHPSCLNL